MFAAIVLPRELLRLYKENPDHVDQAESRNENRDA